MPDLESLGSSIKVLRRSSTYSRPGRDVTCNFSASAVRAPLAECSPPILTTDLTCVVSQRSHVLDTMSRSWPGPCRRSRSSLPIRVQWPWACCTNSGLAVWGLLIDCRWAFVRNYLFSPMYRFVVRTTLTVGLRFRSRRFCSLDHLRSFQSDSAAEWRVIDSSERTRWSKPDIPVSTWQDAYGPPSKSDCDPDLADMGHTLSFSNISIIYNLVEAWVGPESCLGTGPGPSKRLYSAFVLCSLLDKMI